MFLWYLSSRLLWNITHIYTIVHSDCCNEISSMVENEDLPTVEEVSCVWSKSCWLRLAVVAQSTVDGINEVHWWNGIHFAGSTNLFGENGFCVWWMLWIFFPKVCHTWAKKNTPTVTCKYQSNNCTTYHSHDNAAYDICAYRIILVQ